MTPHFVSGPIDFVSPPAAKWDRRGLAVALPEMRLSHLGTMQLHTALVHIQAI
jgi:hypothetical protein